MPNTKALGTAFADPVLENIQVNYVPVAINATATATPDQVAGGYITSTSGAATTFSSTIQPARIL